MSEKIVQFNEEIIKGQIKELVRGSVEETLNGLLEADYIVIEMAGHILGENWMREYVDKANAGGIERVLV